MKDKILEEFNNQQITFSDCLSRIEGLIKDLLDHSSISIHKIEGRIKCYESLSRKIDKKDKYESLSDITDIIGLRIITFLESDVDKIQSIIRSEFKIDDVNSIDKRKLEINQFGYRSLHIVSELDDSRCELSEYKKYKSLKFEIQIRSVLQHAWAEIEHDLGYKSKASIPESYRRNFNRLAALLETADIEFDRLKGSLKDYEAEVPELINSDPKRVTLDQASLNAFVLSHPIFEEVREYIRNDCKSDFYYHKPYKSYIEKFELFEIKNIQELKTLLEENKDDYINFVKEFIGKGISPKLSYSLPLYWFQHFLAGRTGDLDFVTKYLTYGSSSIRGPESKYVETYDKVKGK